LALATDLSTAKNTTSDNKERLWGWSALG